MSTQALVGLTRAAGRAASSSGSGLQHAWAWLVRTGLLREVVLVACAMLVYFGIRNLTVGAEDAAEANADSLLRLERAVGIDWEDEAQSLIDGSDWLVTGANWVYIWGHWPVILSMAVALFVLRPRRYFQLRNAVFLSGGIGFAFFAFFPVAPPRLLDLGLADTVTERSDAYRALQPPGLTNQYAAFPSLHFGWNVLLGIVVALAWTGLAIRLFAVLLPLAMGVAVVATANHFVIDVAGGLVIVLFAFAVVTVRQRRRDHATLDGDGVLGGDTHRPPERVAVRRRAPRG